MAVTDAAYPVELERDIVGTDDARFRLRPIRPDDAERLVSLHGRLSEQTVYQRFFTVMRRLPTDWARYLADVDYRRRLALVVERRGADGPELVGVARYEPTSEPGRVEVAQLRGIEAVATGVLRTVGQRRAVRPDGGRHEEGRLGVRHRLVARLLCQPNAGCDQRFGLAA